MKNKHVAYLHGCGLSQGELMEIFSDQNSAKEFYERLNHITLEKYVKNITRRSKILEEYHKLSTKTIDAILQKLGVNIIVFGDADYPESLKNIPHIPYILYVRGIIPKQDMFGVVGSRKITSYGKRVISQVVPDISKVFPVVSGGAAGCDTYAHKSALESGNSTVVVVGTGIDQTYPVGNEMLFTEIANSGGAVVSIFRIGEPGNPYNFPVRNEIVVGLSRGILVVEAQIKSGSLITAGLALDLGKDLFSIPGDILSSGSAGTNKLIKCGEAKCVTEAMDILEEYNALIKQTAHKDRLPLLSDIESKIYTLISSEDCDIDTLAEKLGLQTREITMKLSLLELKNIVKKDLPGKYILI